MRRIRTLQDVVDWDLCTGCGACEYFCENGAVTLFNIPNRGIRPQFESAECASCTKCLSMCPGYSLTEENVGSRPVEAEREFGPALEIWEGYASDPEIRYRASSGGLLTALANYCLEREGMKFVLHTDAITGEPWANRSVKSTTRNDVMSRAGSRYSPSAPSGALASIEESSGECVFIGKPCDVAAVSAVRKHRPALDRNLGVVLTFFCAGTPSSEGTLDLVRSFGIDLNTVKSLKYRGDGWPGEFRVESETGPEKTLSYAESWGKLTHFRPLRCNLCPDGLGRAGDISCGDAWESAGNTNDHGRSIAIVRTERGRKLLHGAIKANYVQLEPVTPAAVLAAQEQLLQRRRELFGRLLAMALCGIPIPKFYGFSLFHSWLRQPLATQIRTVLGTMRRALIRGWWKRRPRATRLAMPDECRN